MGSIVRLTPPKMLSKFQTEIFEIYAYQVMSADIVSSAGTSTCRLEMQVMRKTVPAVILSMDAL